MTRKKLIGVSPSQLSAYQLCKRRWAATYVYGARDGGSEATERGGAIHSLLERHLTGLEVNWDTAYGQLLRHALPLFPEPGEDTYPEQQMEFVWEGFEHQCTSDTQDWRRNPDKVYVMDLKTTGSHHGIKSARALAKDAQTILNVCSIFAWAADNGRPTPDMVVSRWVYLVVDALKNTEDLTHAELAEHVRKAPPPKVKAVEIGWNLDSATKAYFEHVHPDMTALKDLERMLRDHHIPPAGVDGDSSACPLYPPTSCPFTSLCGYGEGGEGKVTLGGGRSLGDPFDKSPRRVESVAQAYGLSEDEALALLNVWQGEVPDTGEARKALRPVRRLALFAPMVDSALARGHEPR